MADKDRIFGHVPDVKVGAHFDSFAAMNAAKLHRPSQGGISSSENEGADSIVVSGGYEDDQDFGDEIIYTGQGGRDAAGKHIADQPLSRGNLALVKNQMEGLPVRVIRGAHAKNPYAPKSGYRYDGLYTVDSHWHETGKSGFKVWRYRLLKIDANDLEPDTKEKPALSPGSNHSPTRKTSLVQRIVRDTKQAKELKKHYDFACQVCGMQINTAAGPYAEAAHIRPLGAPHNGPDIAENIICLCPNHHVMFDLGIFAINDDLSLIGIDGSLIVSPKHALNIDHIRYHRMHYFNKAK